MGFQRGVGAGIVIGALLAGTAFAVVVSRTHTPASRVEPPHGKARSSVEPTSIGSPQSVVTTAPDLERELKQNEVTAKQWLQGRTVWVRGEITRIADAQGGWTIYLQRPMPGPDPDPFRIIFQMPPSSKYQANQYISKELVICSGFLDYSSPTELRFKGSSIEADNSKS